MSMTLEGRLNAACNSIQLGNNGYADIGNDEALADAVRERGFTVIRTTNLHGLPVFRGFTLKSQEALAQSPFGVSNVKRFSAFVPDGDFEAAILARQEARMSANF